ncbi:hypothetical protein [Micromonospora citrea]|uniref:hypothetical protein n=1 Tax=Micromonospora citrea TaxID=47855 RepID=UPI000B828E6F|nr:hypothetical protein [Micromonospora citrea]
MLSRFNIVPVLRGHWKGLSDGRYRTYRPDWVARCILAAPVGVFVLMLWSGTGLAAPTPLLTAVALLAGGMLSTFTHLSTLRLKLTEWLEKFDDGEDARFVVERESLDETAAHLLAGSLVCAIDAAVLVVGMNVSTSDRGALEGIWAALGGGLSSYILLVFIMVMPRMYSAYVEINSVSTKLSGFSKDR